MERLSRGRGARAQRAHRDAVDAAGEDAKGARRFPADVGVAGIEEEFRWLGAASQRDVGCGTGGGRSTRSPCTFVAVPLVLYLAIGIPRVFLHTIKVYHSKGIRSVGE